MAKQMKRVNWTLSKLIPLLFECIDVIDSICSKCMCVSDDQIDGHYHFLGAFNAHFCVIIIPFVFRHIDKKQIDGVQISFTHANLCM